MTSLGNSLANVQTDEVKAAAERYRKYLEDSYADYALSYSDSGRLESDETTIVDAFIRLLAASEAEQAEREKPIDGFSLKALHPQSQRGEALFTSATFIGRFESVVQIEGVIGDDRGGFLIIINGRPVSEIKTRGQLLDLLRALGIETK